MVLVGECLPSNHKALSSTPSTAKKKKIAFTICTAEEISQQS
jgi:hypothetical protein